MRWFQQVSFQPRPTNNWSRITFVFSGRRQPPQLNEENGSFRCNTVVRLRLPRLPIV
ncbi:DUF2550 family protein (plasmid) [Kovacikia minuta CCNUW1]|nr:DUF2550 family protein [Kovacikia minuta CCNUW1]